MRFVVRDRELRGRNGEDRLRELARSASGLPNGELRELDEMIVAAETEVGMSLGDVRTALMEERMQETDAVCALLLLASQRDLLAGT